MNPITAITEYLRSAKAELEKVSWPSRRDTIRYSSLVIGVSVIMAAFFATLDMGLNHGVDFLLQRRTVSSAPAAAPDATNLPIDISPDSLQATTPDGKPADATITPVAPGTAPTAPAPTPATPPTAPSTNPK